MADRNFFSFLGGTLKNSAGPKATALRQAGCLTPRSLGRADCGRRFAQRRRVVQQRWRTWRGKSYQFRISGGEYRIGWAEIKNRSQNSEARRADFHRKNRSGDHHRGTNAEGLTSYL